MRGIALSALLLLAIPAAAQADDLDCLLGLKGQIVRWDQAWQEDLSDQNIPYRVQSVIDNQSRPREVTLFLVTEALASRKIRKAVINRPMVAQLICGRSSGGPRNPSQIPALGAQEYEIRRAVPNRQAKKTKEVTPEDLSFRTLIAGNWVAAHPAPNAEKFVCLVKNTAYACGERDYKFVQSVLSQSGMQPRTILTVDSNKPFIRNLGDGWKLASAVDLEGNQAVTQCEIGKQVFTCLVSERNIYRAQLTELAIEDSKARRWEKR